MFLSNLFTRRVKDLLQIVRLMPVVFLLGCTLNLSIRSLENGSLPSNGGQPNKGVDDEIDTTKPTIVGSVTLGAVPDDLAKTPTFTFNPATDIGSGIDYYELSVFNASDSSLVVGWQRFQSGYALTNLSPLLTPGQSYFVKLRTVDKAGNISESINSSDWTAPTQAEIYFSTADSLQVNESQSTAILPVNLSIVRTVDTQISFSTTGTAFLINDLSLSGSGTITIPAGQLTANLVVNIVDDSTIEPIEFADLAMVAPTSSLVTLGEMSSRRLIITDNDIENSAMVVSGANHNCYKNTSGQVKCWGRNNWGQLGIGDTNDRGDNANEMGASLPVVNLGSGGLVVSKLSAGNGGDNTCALFTNGRIKCWGRGDNWSEPGYMGYGHSNNIGDQSSDMGDNLPFISLGSGVLATDITTSSFNTCAITTVGKLKCWGTGFHGANGNASDSRLGSSLNDMGDSLPYVDLGTDRKVLKVAMGSFHRCAILDNLKVKCWGWNTAGELGYEDGVTRGDDLNEMGDNLPYVDLGPNAQVIDITAASSGYFESGGVHHTCALLSDGSVKCWGGNGSGQLGYENTASRGSSVGSMGANLPAVNLGSGRTAKRIFASHYSTCAILDNDSLKCWGSGAAGQLGYNSANNYGNTAGTMGDNLPNVFLGVGRTVKSVSGSFLEWNNAHRCAVLDDNSVKCWGKNLFGELGVGSLDQLGDSSGEMESLLPIIIF